MRPGKRSTVSHTCRAPRAPKVGELEVRLNYGRLQTLVSATATSARDVLLACDEMLAESGEPPEGAGEGGKGGLEEPPEDEGEDDGGPEEPPVSSGNGEPHVEGSGNLPQAQPQHGIVEVSLDDIDEGADEPPGVARGRAGEKSCSTWLPGRPSWYRSSRLAARMPRSSPLPRHEPCCRALARPHRRGPDAEARQAALRRRAQARGGGARVRP